MQSLKEKAANIGASAKASIEKTKATLQEKVEKLTAHDAMEKEMATQRKEERKAVADLNKNEAIDHAVKKSQAGKVNRAEAHGSTVSGGALGNPVEVRQGMSHGGLVEDSGVRTGPIGLPEEKMGLNANVEGTGTGTGIGSGLNNSVPGYGTSHPNTKVDGIKRELANDKPDDGIGPEMDVEGTGHVLNPNVLTFNPRANNLM